MATFGQTRSRSSREIRARKKDEENQRTESAGGSFD
jgi:hypothetical protein